jgi:hypothetical protein
MVFLKILQPRLSIKMTVNYVSRSIREKLRLTQLKITDTWSLRRAEGKTSDLRNLNKDRIKVVP